MEMPAPARPRRDPPRKPAPPASLARVPGAERVKYTKVIEALEQLATGGTIAAGQRLPPHRSLARQLGVTIATLTRAMADLTRRGVLVTRSGSGTFVASASAATSVMPDGIADLRLCLPPTGPVEAVLGDTLTAVARIPSLFGYEALGGDAAARQAGADWLRLRGLSPTADAVLVVQGAHEGMLAALQAVTRPGDRVLCERLHYTGLRRMAALLQIELIGVPIDAEGLDTEAFARLCREVRPRAAVLTPVTQNPTTATMSPGQRQAVIAAARAADLVLIEDDINGHLSSIDETPLALLAPERVILVTSLSKSIAPGLRVGYVLAPARLRDAVESALYTLGWIGSGLHGAVAKRLIADGGAAACLRAQRTEAMARVRLARLHLGHAVVVGDGAQAALRPLYHAWLPMPPGRRAEEFAAELMTRQVLVAPAYGFMQDDSQPPEAVRLSLGGESRALLTSALQRIATVLAQRGPGLGAVV
ncbi:aminotransferase-like domain-containing protein [Plastoroseomonas hellenica]|uniref:aminotransferase-like domain-containing protein n=1 Tax=Plastoroseomonas hellenica TaxID=2687306 RepID=UPI001BABE750|nr:PLP-dependent aminotransferase family protein [Plastoroseomonas hellenica]MBR0643549.1 PLP-dependent aminotransferase family protein [Plastoroseomonas hellenica]